MEYIYPKKDKYDIMMDGLSLVKPELQKEWLKFVDQNYVTEDNKDAVIDSLLLMLALNERGMSFWDAEKFVYAEQYDGIYSICSKSISLFAYFSKKGEEYKKYLKSREGYKEVSKKAKQKK